MAGGPGGGRGSLGVPLRGGGRGAECETRAHTQVPGPRFAGNTTCAGAALDQRGRGSAGGGARRKALWTSAAHSLSQTLVLSGTISFDRQSEGY